LSPLQPWFRPPVACGAGTHTKRFRPIPLAFSRRENQSVAGGPVPALFTVLFTVLFNAPFAPCSRLVQGPVLAPVLLRVRMEQEHEYQSTNACSSKRWSIGGDCLRVCGPGRGAAGPPHSLLWQIGAGLEGEGVTADWVVSAIFILCHGGKPGPPTRPPRRLAGPVVETPTSLQALK
jgi:hypothetical protein